jgi:hypothetical protein
MFLGKFSGFQTKFSMNVAEGIGLNRSIDQIVEATSPGIRAAIVTTTHSQHGAGVAELFHVKASGYPANELWVELHGPAVTSPA